MVEFVSGFLLSMTLILAIGPQNAFVLRQGLIRQDVFWVVLTCAVSDAILITAGVAGLGAAATAVPWLEVTMRFGGAAFLFWYGWQSACSAYDGGQTLRVQASENPQLHKTVATLLALTWLNPHVYIDTVVLIGSVSAQYEDRPAFGAGAVVASTVFFFALGYGARVLVPLFARPRSWQVLDAVIALTMWTIALKLLVM